MVHGGNGSLDDGGGKEADACCDQGDDEGRLIQRKHHLDKIDARWRRI